MTSMTVTVVDANNISVSVIESNAIALTVDKGVIGPKGDQGIQGDQGPIGTVTVELQELADESTANALASSISETNAAISAGAADSSASSAATSATTATTKAGTATTQAAIAATQASNASTSANATAALLLSFRNVFLGPFSSDANAISFATANSITLVSGISYENTTTKKVRIYDVTTWSDQDADAQTQSANATASAVSAAASASTATTQADTATTEAGISTAQAIIATAQAEISTAQADISTAKAGIATTEAASAAASAADAASSAASAAAGGLAAGNNLSDLSNAATARTNLGVPVGSGSSTGINTGDQVLPTLASLGLNNVSNTSDALKPVSTATATAIGVETSRAEAAEALLAPQATTYTKTQTDTAIASLLGISPDSRNTIALIDAQLTADETAAASLVSAVALKAPLANPIFTGTVTVPNGSVLGTPTSINLTNATFPTLNQNTSGTAAGLSITLAVATGGTGLSTLGTAGQVLEVNPAGTALQYGTASGGATYLTYANCSALRTTVGTNGQSATVEGVGLFTFVTGSTEPDDGETCFAATGGRWLLDAVSWDAAFALWLPDFYIHDERIEDAENNITAAQANLTTLNAFQAKFLGATFSMTLTSLGAVTSSDFTVTVTSAAMGDSVIVNSGNSFGTSSADKAALRFNAYVSAANTVTVSIRNASASTASMTASTWAVRVIKQ